MKAPRRSSTNSYGNGSETMTRQYAIGFLIWVAIVIATKNVSAQSPTPPEKPAQQAEEVVEFYWWNGDVPTVEYCVGAIVDAKLLFEVDADSAKTESILNEVWLACTSNTEFPGQEDILIKVAVARAELFQSLGRHVDALRATEQLLPQKQDIQQFESLRDKLTLANMKGIQRARKLTNDPRLVKLRALLKKQKPAADPLAAIVYNAFYEENYAIIAEIGAPAQPAFMKEILASTDQMPANVGIDPLRYFLKMNERRGAELLLANLDHGGYIWKRRIIRMMTSLYVFTNPGTWSNEAPFVCLEPEWIDMLVALLGSPETALQSVRFAAEPFLRDHFTPELQHALVYGIDNYELDFVNALLQVIDRPGVVQSALPVYEALVKHKNPQVSRFGARALTNYDSNATLRGLATSADASIRAAVAHSLQPRTATFVYRNVFVRSVTNGTEDYDFETRERKRNLVPTIGPEERKVLTALAVDPDPKVRSIAAEAIVGLSPPLDESVYLSLAQDADSQVRSRMAWVTGVSGAFRSSLLTQLAGDSSSSVQSDVDDVLHDAPLATAPEPYLAALELRLFDKENPMDESHQSPIIRNLLQNPIGLQAYTEWLLQQDSPQVGLLRDFLQRRGEGVEKSLGLQDRELVGLLALALEAKSDDGYFAGQMLTAIRDARPSRRSAMRIALADKSLSTALRLTAAELAALDGGAEFQQALIDLLRDEYWKINAPNEDDDEALADTVKNMPEGEINQLVLQVIKDPQIPDALAQTVARCYSEGGILGREVSLAVLSRWFGPDQPYTTSVSMAITHLATLPDDASTELLITAALHRDYTSEAIETMVSLRRPEFLPTLERCLSAEWVTSSGLRSQIREQAARGIPGFLTVEAGEILLRGLTSASNNVRALCGQGLNQIEQTRERRLRWEETKQDRPDKESALAELLVMLDSDHLEIRVQAIRGVATFGAIEYLPTLIRLLKDPNKEVVAAARSAIDTLSARSQAPRKE